MKRIILLFAVAGFIVPAMAGTRHLGNYSFINTDGPFKIAVNASVAARNLDRDYLLFVMYVGTGPGIRTTVYRDDITMIFGDKEIKLPTLGDFRKQYNRDVQDMVILSHETEHIFPSEMSNFEFQKHVDLFPARNQTLVVSDEFSVNSKTGCRTKLYFKKPGIQKGDTVILRIQSKEDPNLKSELAITF